MGKIQISSFILKQLYHKRKRGVYSENLQSLLTNFAFLELFLLNHDILYIFVFLGYNLESFDRKCEVFNSKIDLGDKIDFHQYFDVFLL